MPKRPDELTREDEIQQFIEERAVWIADTLGFTSVTEAARILGYFLRTPAGYYPNQVMSQTEFLESHWYHQAWRVWMRYKDGQKPWKPPHLDSGEPY
jgi:hypothetical protein